MKKNLKWIIGLVVLLLLGAFLGYHGYTLSTVGEVMGKTSDPINVQPWLFDQLPTEDDLVKYPGVQRTGFDAKINTLNNQIITFMVKSESSGRVTHFHWDKSQSLNWGSYLVTYQGKELFRGKFNLTVASTDGKLFSGVMVDQQGDTRQIFLYKRGLR